MTEHTLNDPDVRYVVSRVERADALGLACTVGRDGVLRVVGETHKSQAETYEVTWAASPDGDLSFGCTCKAGQFRPGPVPCKHAAAAGRLLERDGVARFGADAPGWSLTLLARTVKDTAVQDLHDLVARATR